MPICRNRKSFRSASENSLAAVLDRIDLFPFTPYKHDVADEINILTRPLIPQRIVGGTISMILDVDHGMNMKRGIASGMYQSQHSAERICISKPVNDHTMQKLLS